MSVNYVHSSLQKTGRNIFDEPNAQNYYGERTRKYLLSRIFNAYALQYNLREKRYKKKFKTQLLDTYSAEYHRYSKFLL